MNRSPGWPNLLGLVDPDPKDPGGLQTALGHPPGWVVFQRSLFSDATVYRGDDWTGLSDAGTAVICCLEWEPGSGGTVPGLEHLPAFASRCREYVQGTQGCHIWVVGDEPNRSSQWPGAAADPHPDAEGSLEVLPPRYLPGRYSQLTGHPSPATTSDTQPITPEQYAECLKQTGAAIRSLPDHEDDLILCAAVAPWNTDFRAPDNPSGDWIDYFETVCAALGADDLQGFALHAATSGSDLGEITTEERLAFPFAGRRRGFRAYLDFIHAIPPRFHHLPVFMTEVSRLEPWSNDDNGWTGAAMADIQSHNRTRIQNPIRCAALYTWNSKSPWTLRGKPLLAADIARSIAALEVRRYQDSLLPVAWTRVEVPARVEPDRPVTVHLAFENAGAEPLAASGDAPVRISCMLGRTDPVSGNCIVEADRRFPLPSDLGPGQGCEVSIELEAPEDATDITLFIGIIPAGFLWSATVVEDAIQVPLRQEPEEEVEPEEATAADAADQDAGEPDAEPAAKPAAALEHEEDPTRDLEGEPPPSREETAVSPETDLVAEEQGVSEPEEFTEEEEKEAEPVSECPEPEVREPPAIIDLSAFFFRRLSKNSAARVLTDVTRIVFVESRFNGDPPINEITDHFAKQGYEQVPLHFLITEPNCIYQVHKAEHNPIPYAANLTSAVVLSLPKAQGDTHGWLSRFDALADTVFEVLAAIFNGNPPPELEVGVDTLDGDLGFKSGASNHLEDICLLLSSRWTDGVDSPVPLTFIPVALPLEGSPPIAREPDPAEASPEMETEEPDTDTMPDPTEPDTTETAVPTETAAAGIEPVLTFDDDSGFVRLERDSARWLNLRFSHLQATSVCLWVSGENGTLPLAQFRRIHNMAASEVYCHYVVEPSGRILDTGRPAAAREHLPPKYKEAIHICLRGRGPHPQRDLDQLDACSGLLVELLHSPTIADRWQAIDGSLADVLLVGSSRWQHGPAWTDAMAATVSEVDVDRDPAAGSEQHPLEVQPHSADPPPGAGAETGKPDRGPRTVPAASSVTGQGGGGIDAPPIVDRVGTIPKHPVLDFPKRQLSAIRQIVVHHSGFPSHVTPHAIAESLVFDQLAMDGTEPGLPYHFFVQVDGTVEQIHDLSVACHSTQDGHDRIVAVCLAGTFSQGINPTPLQLEHAGHLIAWLLQTCYLSEADIAGHRDVDPFEEVCPGEEWSSGHNWGQTLRYHISRHLSGNPADAIPVT